MAWYRADTIQLFFGFSVIGDSDLPSAFAANCQSYPSSETRATSAHITPLCVKLSER